MFMHTILLALTSHHPWLQQQNDSWYKKNLLLPG